MVINWPQLKARDYEHVYTDIAAIRSLAPHPIVLKVILETSQLSQFDILAGCKICEAAGADFVKTSTGFDGPGASFDNVRLMKSVVGDGVRVKASGGIKTVNECVAMMEVRTFRSSGFPLYTSFLSIRSCPENSKSREFPSVYRSSEAITGLGDTDSEIFAGWSRQDRY